MPVEQQRLRRRIQAAVKGQPLDACVNVLMAEYCECLLAGSEGLAQYRRNVQAVTQVLLANGDVHFCGAKH